MTYGCQTWSLNKQMTNKLRTAQRAMERKMLDLELKDKIPCSEIRKRTKIIDIIEYTLKQKWKWAGHIARLKDNRWTKRCTEWQPRKGKRSRGRPSRRWQDDITEKEGTTWIRKATDRRRWKTLMEGYILQWMDKAQMKVKMSWVRCVPYPMIFFLVSPGRGSRSSKSCSLSLHMRFITRTVSTFDG